MCNVDVFLKQDFESFVFFLQSEDTTISMGKDISSIITALSSGKHLISLIGESNSGKSTIANAIGNGLSQKNADKQQGDFGFSWSVWENENATIRRMDVAGHLAELPSPESDNGFDLLEHATREQQRASVLVFETSRNNSDYLAGFKKEIPTKVQIYLNPNTPNYKQIKSRLSLLSQKYPEPLFSFTPTASAFKL